MQSGFRKTKLTAISSAIIPAFLYHSTRRCNKARIYFIAMANASVTTQREFTRALRTNTFVDVCIIFH